MTSDMNEHDKTLRIVRFFLPRLGRQELAHEIEEEKNRLEQARQSRLSEIRRAAEDILHEETKSLRSSLKEHDEKRNRNVVFLILSAIAVLAGIILCTINVGVGLLVSVVGGGVLVWAGLDYSRIIAKIVALRNDIMSREEAIHKKRDHDLNFEENSFREQLAALAARLDELVQLYEQSIASEDEVVEFCDDRLTELQEQLTPALGLHPDDVLDERSAEIWAPSFLQGQDFPVPVLRDIARSEQEIADWAEDIIEPMRSAVPTENQWQAFRSRVLSILGLCEPTTECDGDESVQLNSLRAVRFSTSRQAYLAGHYFYQKIVCVEDSIGLFRAYVNVISRRVPHTYALQIMYSDVAAIGIETSLNREKFDISSMMIDQHTHTLTLELSSGSNYRMSGDAGSAGQIKLAGDTEVEKVVSRANQAFRDQIINVRSLIRDVKASAINSSN